MHDNENLTIQILSTRIRRGNHQAKRKKEENIPQTYYKPEDA
jgi:hypothetical protein